MSKVFATPKDHWQDFLSNSNASCCRVSRGDGDSKLAVWNGLTNVCYILNSDQKKVEQLVLEPVWEEEGRSYERHFDERAFPEFGYIVTYSPKQWVRELYNLA